MNNNNKSNEIKINKINENKIIFQYVAGIIINLIGIFIALFFRASDFFNMPSYAGEYNLFMLDAIIGTFILAIGFLSISYTAYKFELGMKNLITANLLLPVSSFVLLILFRFFNYNSHYSLPFIVTTVVPHAYLCIKIMGRNDTKKDNF